MHIPIMPSPYLEIFTVYISFFVDRKSERIETLLFFQKIPAIGMPYKYK